MVSEAFKIIEPGICATIQDKGRMGWRKYGMPVSGAMDPYAYNTLNRLLGNRAGSAALEITGSWFSGEFLKDCNFAVCGADPRASIDAKPIEPNKVYTAGRGNILKFSEMRFGIRAYIGISGGFIAPEFLGSMSMTKGVRLKSGDILGSVDTVNEMTSVKIDFSYIRKNGFYKIKVREGPDSHFFSKNILKNFMKEQYTVSQYLDRMGIRLEPNENIAGGPDGIVTKPVFPGCIQLTKAGVPIIIMNDGQTTGGYPVIAVVERDDLKIAGQLKSGDSLVFKGV